MLCSSDYEDITTYEKFREFRLQDRLFVDDLQISKKDKYKTKDVCEALHISRTTYKDWEKQGCFQMPRREPESNFRIFNETELLRLKKLFKQKARRFKGKRKTICCFLRIYLTLLVT